MIVKRLREQRHWSQEQLARLAGLSLRTVQRVEAGQKASLETVKALAAVLETDIDRLTEDIMIIDKTSELWKAEPWPVRALLWGINRRSKELLIVECLLILVGVASWLVFEQPHITTPLAFLFAYVSAKLVAYVDSKGYW